MSKRNTGILIVALLVITMLAIMLTVFIENAKDKFPESIRVSENGVTEKVYAVRDLRLNPTESKEYTVSLVCDASGSYKISLDYEETADGGMKPFVNVTVSCDGNTVYEGTLAALINGEDKIEFEGELQEKEPLNITIRYEMPRETTNEAQGTYTDFEIHIKIQKS